MSQNPQSITLSLDVQARDAFFAQYVAGTTGKWSFLTQFYMPSNSSQCLTLSLEAVSLAYLSHQVYSEVATINARKKYISALQITNKALKCPEEATQETTVVAALLLDLFEKITNSSAQHDKSWVGHVNGALTLVKLRGLNNFQDPYTLRVIVRLTTNFIISSVASETRVPDEIYKFREHATKFLGAGDPKWELTGLMGRYADISCGVRIGLLSTNEAIAASSQLDSKFEALSTRMPDDWQPTTIQIPEPCGRVYECYFNVYARRHINQAWNVIRLARILLNESILEHAFTQNGDYSTTYNFQVIHGTIVALASGIYASIPQYTDCLGAARHRILPENRTSGANHVHTSSQISDIYSLILPLYVAGRSKASPDSLKQWAIDQLEYVGSHFGIKNAKLAGDILKRKGNVSPWVVYAMLGSYAFAA